MKQRKVLARQQRRSLAYQKVAKRDGFHAPGSRKKPFPRGKRR